MAAGSQVELFAAISRDDRSGMSNSALQRKHEVGYRTVAAALEPAWRMARKPSAMRASRPYRDVIRLVARRSRRAAGGISLRVVHTPASPVKKPPVIVESHTRFSAVRVRSYQASLCETAAGRLAAAGSPGVHA